ncbi:oligopeptide-binding protein AppA precursor [Variibacter gotjawalensis]|uniref:Oligopeptide-binding protein AppA n=1 Tax=Variibacter gotjawalensis TaxID=1333996 RepID=A0A0S3PQH2_9BRAD|nr:microcin C transport system substrate-binding protein [Variibacter gotjawalensis]BAT58175.1 oligopeptide-binding protein AppA precursor [Variibacter gotjawalensis]
MRSRGVMKLGRRDLLIASAATLAASTLPGRLAAQEATETHGLSIFGDLKYPADFKQLDFVNPQAPKGGIFSEIKTTIAYNQNFLTFNTLNAYILNGDGAQGMELTFATLMARATDEPDAIYGLAARAVRVSADKLAYTFLLRPEAKFHDGTQLTAHDVVFSLTTLKEKGHPNIQQMLRDLVEAKADDDASVTLRFAEKRARDVPLYAATLPIFSRAYYATKTFDSTSLDIPLGSGAYRVGRFEAGRYNEFERVKNWWGADLPIMRGQLNFDVVRYEYYRDREVAFEGFTGKSYLFREEFTSRIWATRYEFPAMKDGRVKREVLVDETPSGAQGWFINTRRERFQDRRVREALINAFDFEWTNKNLMYGSYNRTHSVFQNSDMMATGKPSAEEMALLEPFRGKVPDDVFGEPYLPPVSDGSGADRVSLRKATQLLNDAGWTIRDGKRRNAKGEQLTLEFLIDEPTFQPHHMPFIKNLGTIGIDATLRVVDAVQFRRRLDDFDFDATVQRFSFSTTPGDSLRTYFSSQAAAIKGSRNLAGMADPAIDMLIEKIIAADTRPELVFAARALDRVIRANRYWVPHWNKASHWIAYWDLYSRPAAKPKYARGVMETWWYDRDKAAKTDRAG